MIVRTWHGCVPLKYAESFAQHLQNTGVEHAQNTPGNLGAFVKMQIQADQAHFFLATYWQDIKAVKAFAGDEYDVAVTWPEDERFALISDPYVFHHHVATVTPL
ncbi:hypothetical protein [Kalamiella sp. sgz302252]|uniref:hypothetical protein n=1 Tax=Pantoea sp. sgz302252 TaxID=3341827 RepID=UPI0036D32092